MSASAGASQPLDSGKELWPKLAENDTSLLPVTALHSLRADGCNALLVGTGTKLRLVEDDTRVEITSLEIFETQTIHGITAAEIPGGLKGFSSSFVLVWGGPFFRIVEVKNSSSGHETTDGLSLVAAVQVESAYDWILDARFSPLQRIDLPPTNTLVAALLTSNNALVFAHFDLLLLQRTPLPSNWVDIDVNPSYIRSVLYSGYIVWLSSNRVLVASGTVFGQILVWSHLLSSSSPTSRGRSTKLYLVLAGHEGSVFGVHISEEFPLEDTRRLTRLLASCSDDRTIRVWDISAISTDDDHSLHQEKSVPWTPQSTGFGALSLSRKDEARVEPVAFAWGHLSRIWGVRFLGFSSSHVNRGLQLISYGEDARLQCWIIDIGNPKAGTDSLVAEILPLTQYSCHSGKNIWSLNTFRGKNGYHALTGGADGAITSLSSCFGESLIKLTGQWTTAEIIDSIKRKPQQDESRNAEGERPKDMIKQYGFVSSNDFIAVTQNGHIFLGTICPIPSGDPHPNKLIWQELEHIQDFRSYAIISTDTRLGIAVIGGGTGKVRLYLHEHRTFHDICLANGKVSGLFILDPADTHGQNSILGDSEAFFSLLVTCKNSKVAFASTVLGSGSESSESLTIKGPYRVPLFDTFEITSVLHIPHRHCIIAGSRTSGYGFYDTTKRKDETLRMVMCTRSNAQKDAITSITLLPHPKYDTSLVEHVLTCGRDGFFRIFSLQFQGHGRFTLPVMSLVHESTPPLGPILEGIYLDMESLEIHIFGFRGKEFIAWNETTQRETMAIDCGGAHRSWAYCPPTSSAQRSSFLWTKASTFNIFVDKALSYNVAKPGGHGREIKAVSVSDAVDFGDGNKRRLIATGAEDTTIRIFTVPGENIARPPVNFNCLRTLKKHVSGIQDLKWSSCGKYLFSCGGCEEFFVWKTAYIPGFGIGFHCHGVCPIEGDDTPDLRITNFDVLEINPTQNPPIRPTERQFLICMALSNAIVKLYLYSSHLSTSSFTTLYHGTYMFHCLTQSRFLPRSTSLHMYCASTNGHLSCWNLSSLGEQCCSMKDGTLILDPSLPIRETDGASTKKLYWTARKAVHQSSVKCMIEIALTDSETLIVSGGDDNALALTRFSTLPSSTSSTTTEISTLRVARAHASAVTAIARMPVNSQAAQQSRFDRPFLIATSGNDQRLKFWDVNIDLRERGVEGISIRKKGSVHTAVADISSMDTFDDNGVVKLILGGVGMELWSLRKLGE